jgi:hypothetical protein
MNRLVFVVGVAIFAGYAQTAIASTISPPYSFSYPSGSGDIANDSANVFANEFFIYDNFTSSGNLALIYSWAGGSPSVDYKVILEVYNNTGFAWQQFTVGWGCVDGTQPCAGGATPVTNDFSTPTSTFEGNATSSVIDIKWTNLYIPSGDIAVFTFGVNTPDNAGGGWIFNQLTVDAPEPQTFVLCGIGLAGLLSKRLRRA